MRITIRRATVDDLPWLRQTVGAFLSEQAQGYPSFDAEELDAFTLAMLRGLTQNPQFGVWAAWRGRTAVGSLGGEIQTRVVGKPHVFAHALWAYVTPEYRKGDVGFRLVEAFAQWAQSLGVEVMECRASAGDTRYADHGYPLVATCYAAPIKQVLDRWRGHAYPPPKPDAPQANGHDTTEPLAVSA
jgi:GNAT superfamily N-acetyltransferase